MNRQESAGFVLDDNLPHSFSKEEEEQQETEEEEEEEGESSEDENEDDEEEEDKGKREKTCSSRYSFSSDYTSGKWGSLAACGGSLGRYYILSRDAELKHRWRIFLIVFFQTKA